jgi:midasin (ATPase involved in ribosome maturation)
LNGLLRLWFDMASLLNEKDLDPTTYSIFRDTLEEWIDQSKGLSLSGFIDQVKLELRGLSNSVTLSTGLSMSTIWETVHPMVPSSLEQWRVYEQLVTLINEFESRIACQIGIKFKL